MDSFGLNNSENQMKRINTHLNKITHIWLLIIEDCNIIVKQEIYLIIILWGLHQIKV